MLCDYWGEGGVQNCQNQMGVTAVQDLRSNGVFSNKYSIIFESVAFRPQNGLIMMQFYALYSSKNELNH